MALVGDAQDEAETGQPFVGRAGFKLSRLIEWAGFERKGFDIWNTIWCSPPRGFIDSDIHVVPAVRHCQKAHWASLVERSRVVVPMGNVALNAFTGRKGILAARGYIQPGPGGTHLVPTIHPSFIQRGQSKYSAVFIHDLQKAVELARTGLSSQLTDYCIDPLPIGAVAWANDYLDRLARDPSIKLAFDIETPYKEEDESESEETDAKTILRIGFSYGTNQALTVPWAPEYMAAIKSLLGSSGPKVVWNAGFDVPHIKAHDISINGLIHDGMVAWHILHSDLPKGLGFVATFTCPTQPMWKHLSGSHPGLYNATDAAVEWESMRVIEVELRKHDLWQVYQSDVLDLEPILVHMSTMGMPINEEKRYERAVWLAEKQGLELRKLAESVPIEARRYSPKLGFVKRPSDISELITIRVEIPVKRCSRCSIEQPLRSHFAARKRPTDRLPQNPCLGAEVVSQVEFVDRFARLDDFKPSRDQLIRYQNALSRPIPRKRDKKTGEWKPTMDEKAIRGLLEKYPDDAFYTGVLAYREMDKIGGSYLGRPIEL